MGGAPMSLADILAAQLATVQDRWFARLYALKPIAIAWLALFWIASGVVGLGPGRSAAIALLAGAGLSDSAATALVIAGSMVDIALGVAVAARDGARAALIGMLAVTVLYVAGGSILLPGLWLDPLGPLMKAIPGVLAAAFTLAILDER
jgi:DoxX-like family